MRVRRRGFTIIEVMAVVVIIGLLAAAATIAVERQMIIARHERVRVDMQTIVNAAKIYRMQRGRPPRDLEELSTGQHATLDQVPVDPWGHGYELEVRGAEVDVLCYGADGVAGGDGEEADLRASVLLARQQPGAR